LFKQNAKYNLDSSIFDRLKEFLEDAQGLETKISCTTNQFIISVGSDDFEEVIEKVIVKPEVILEEEIETIDEEAIDMEIGHEDEEEEVENLYSIKEENEIELSDDEYEGIIQKQDEISYAVETISNGFTCHCDYEAATLIELQNHMSSHKRRTNNVILICCEVGFKDQKAYSIHQKAHENFEAIAPQLALLYSCNDCNMTFNQEDDLHNHNALHQSNSDEYKDKIDRRGAFESHFISDLPRFTPDDSQFQDMENLTCGYCLRKFSENAMKVHMLFFHVNSVFCPHDNRCFVGSKHVRLFSDHIRNKHPEIFNKNSLYNCRHCKQTFTSNFEKLAHMKKCDAKAFPCENHCNKRFATEWLLKQHIKQISGEERFSCDECGKRCVSRSDLQIHQRCHTNERPYSCPICEKSFKTSANRSSHMDIHDSDKKHECEVCGKFYRYFKRIALKFHFNFKAKNSKLDQFSESTRKSTTRNIKKNAFAESARRNTSVSLIF
jgi:hypothetical protein